MPGQASTSRVTPAHPLPRAPASEWPGFRLRLFLARQFTVKWAWKHALHEDDATLACDLVRHGMIPAPTSDDPDRDWLCRLLQEAVTSIRKDGSPMDRDAASGLSVIGAMLAAGASPNSQRHTHADAPFARAVWLARLDDAATMLAQGAFTREQAIHQEPLDRALSSSSDTLRPAEWMRLVKDMTNATASLPVDTDDVDDIDADVPALVRWKAFVRLLESTPDDLRAVAVSREALVSFAQESGLRPAIQMALEKYPDLRLEDFLRAEVIHYGRPDVVQRLQAMQPATAAASAPPAELLLRVLDDYEGRASVKDFIAALCQLATSVPDLGAVRTPSGQTLSHRLAANHILVRNKYLAEAFAALHAAGLPNQSACRDAAGRTPLQAMQETATQEDWHLSQWHAATASLVQQEHAQRLAVVAPSEVPDTANPTLRRPRRRA